MLRWPGSCTGQAHLRGTPEGTSVPLTIEPCQLGGVRNFAWLLPQKVARGEQPPLDDDSLDLLAVDGVRAVVALRCDGEAALRLAGRDVPAYAVAAEREACQRRGIRFRQLGCTDFKAPKPDEIAQALRLIDEEVAGGGGVFVHCLAGVGRASMMTCAWLIAQGASGDDAAALHARFAEDAEQRFKIPPQRRADYLRKVGRAESWWALQQIATALGSPITNPAILQAAVRPEQTEDWEPRYWDELRPWRESRPPSLSDT
jgi:hypothetical protein